MSKEWVTFTNTTRGTAYIKPDLKAWAREELRRLEEETVARLAKEAEYKMPPYGTRTLEELEVYIDTTDPHDHKPEVRVKWNAIVGDAALRARRDGGRK